MQDRDLYMLDSEGQVADEYMDDTYIVLVSVFLSASIGIPL